MWLLILISAGIAGYASSILHGDHICPEEERHLVNVTRTVLKNIKIRNYKWCMSVPPRCSYYTNEEQYVPEAAEEVQIRMVSKCCPGYFQDEKGEKCVPPCHGCVHGVCDKTANKCICHAGFWTDNCDEECRIGRWGRNCEFQCSCEKGDCDPVTGYCICPPGWKGNRCEEPIITTTMTSRTTTTDFESSTMTTARITTTTDRYLNLEQRLGKFRNRTRYPPLQKYYTFYITTQSPKYTTARRRTKFKPNQLNDVENWQQSRIYSITEKAPGVINIPSLTNAKLSNVTWLSNNGNPENSSDSSYVQQIDEESTTQQSAEVDTVPVPVARTTTASTGEEDKTKQEQEESVNTKTTDQLVTQPNRPNLKGKAMDDSEISVTSTQVFSKNEEWLGDESRVALENHLSIHQNQAPANNSHLVFSVGAAVGVTATLIAIIAAVFTTKNYRKKKYEDAAVAVNNNHKGENGDGGVPAVSIYTRSVFHAPLPDPPVFENPIFTTPLEYENTKTDFGGTVETQVFCSMHLPTTHSTFRRDSRNVDTFYDHPPSTGSYRAASIPEPPSEHSLEVIKTESKEHLYDEIPCWKQPLAVTEAENVVNNNESVCFYANTTADGNLVIMQQTHM